MQNFLYVISIVLAYLCGSISSAIIICKIMRLPDPRAQGSHNPGATNVLRIGGKKAALLTLLGDILKSLLPIIVAKWFDLTHLLIALIAFAAFIGHLFPIFFRFEGGKGVATLLGCLIGLAYSAALCWVITWLLAAICFRYSSLAALLSALLAPIYIWYVSQDLSYTIAVALMSGLLIFRHHNNIKKLWAGTERKIGEK